MSKRSILVAALCALTGSLAVAQTTPTVESLVASARTYAGADHQGTFKAVCIPPPAAGTMVTATVNPNNYPTDTLPTPPGGTPPRANWYSPPAQIGDNLYWLGTRNHSTLALVNKARETILIDGNFDYATEAEIHKGLEYLGLKPEKVKYSIYAHAHGDHDGGAHLTEARIPGATIVYGEGDWPGVMARTGPHATRHGPENDGTDGRVITSRDTSVKIITYPGHTPGTISMLFEYMDGGKPVKAAYVGGTLFSFTGTAAFYDQYIASVRKFQKAVADFGAVALFTNHSEYDMAFYRANAASNLRREHSRPLQAENGDTPNPYVIGQRRTLNYLAMMEMCLMAGKLRATGSL
jgi:metallo-beta-lactamase class B